MEEGGRLGEPGCPAPALTQVGGGRDRHAVTVGVGADGWLQAVPVALLILAGEAHQAVGCRKDVVSGQGVFRCPLPAPTQRLEGTPSCAGTDGVPMAHGTQAGDLEEQGHQTLALEGFQ